MVSISLFFFDNMLTIDMQITVKRAQSWTFMGIDVLIIILVLLVSFIYFIIRLTALVSRLKKSLKE